MVKIGLVSLVLMLVMVACQSVPQRPDLAIVVPTESPQRVLILKANPALLLGKEQYDMRCAHCHGYVGEGQLDRTIDNTLDLGMLTVPPHNATGHTWQHADDLLIKVIQEGIVNPLDQFPMPPFKDVMTLTEIKAVIRYIKLWWTDEQRAYQERITRYRKDRLAELGTIVETIP
ncbi:MAG: cytochrome c [Anaerolineae bacterium]